MAYSSSSSNLLKTYDVFLSFRGVDTRNTIVSHLYHALRLKGIFTFKDDERIELGDTISARLLKAIQTSWFAVVIISVNHATSSWCLDELQRIMELHEENKIKVVPIFYGVEPSDVRKQTGSFEAPFQKYKESSDMSEKVLKWRDALVQISNLAGRHSNQGVDEAEMIGKVVGSISTRLRIIKPTEMMYFVGMESHMDRLNPLFSMESEDEVRMVGILGMAGIGKTTIAKCLYARFSHQYEACCFMEDVSKIYNNEHGGGAKHLQTELLSVITHDADIKLWSTDAGYNDIKSRLGHIKFFLVLDGVDKLEQIDALAKETSWFGPGSRIIITTRDRGLLNACQVNDVHEIKCLDDNDALQIFKQTAFRGGVPINDSYEQLSVRASQLAHGLPSALVAFGSLLKQKTTILEWEQELSILETSPHEDIKNILMTSYNGLDQRDKNVFLHVACIFNRGYLQHIKTFLDNGDSRVNRLAAKSFVDITTDGCVNMHFLVVQVGREIVWQESGGRPSEQRFLWDTKEFCNVMEENIGLDKLEGLALHLCEMVDRLPTRSNGFSTMNNLIFLKLFLHMVDTDCNLQLDGYGLSSKLKLLHWDAYPSKRLPINFRMDKLVEINLRFSNLVNLWNESQRLPSLRRLYLTGSRNLIQLPDLSTAADLEELILDGCTSLRRIQGSINGLNLRKLNIINCGTLKPFLSITLSQETHTSRRDCHKIIVISSGTTVTNTFPTDMSIEGRISIQLLGLRGNAEYLSFGSKQQILDQSMTMEHKPVTSQLMSDSNSSKSIEIKQFSYMESRTPFHCSSFSHFPCLTELKLINLNIERIPDDICHLQFLETLELCGNDFTSLPTNMVELTTLKYLSLRDCRKLTALPQLTQVETLILSDCVKLRSLQEDQATNCLLELWLDNCNDVQRLSENLSRFTKLTYLDLSRHDFETLPPSISELLYLETLCLNNCNKLKSIKELSWSVQYLYAHNCNSLLNFSFPSSHHYTALTRHLDLSHCFSLHVEGQLMDEFLYDHRPQVPAFACLPRFARYNFYDRKAQGNSRTISVPPKEILGFVVTVEIRCEEPFHMQFPASSCNWKWESGRLLRINLKPNLYLSTEMQSEMGAPSCRCHTLVIRVPNSINNEDDGELQFRPHLLLPEESQFPNAQIRSEITDCQVRTIDEISRDLWCLTKKLLGSDW